MLSPNTHSMIPRLHMVQRQHPLKLIYPHQEPLLYTAASNPPRETKMYKAPLASHAQRNPLPTAPSNLHPLLPQNQASSITIRQYTIQWSLPRNLNGTWLTCGCRASHPIRGLRQIWWGCPPMAAWTMVWETLTRMTMAMTFISSSIT